MNYLFSLTEIRGFPENAKN